MDSRVGELALTVYAPPALWDTLKEPAERFAHRVLQRCDELLERLAPGRVVLFRALDMRWRLADGALHTDGEIEAFAREIAAAIDERARATSAAPSPADDMAVFENEAAWRAAHLSSVASGEVALPWYFARLEAEGAPPGALVREANAELAAETVLRLARGGTLGRVLERLPIDAVRALARAVLGGIDSSAGASPASRTQTSAADPPRDARFDAAKRLLDFAREAGEPPARGRAVGDDLPPERRKEREPPTDLERSGETHGSRSPPGDSKLDVPLGETSSDRGDAARWTTRYGGLFYLLNAATELGVGEALWKACLHEPAVLVRAASRVLGPEGADDVAPSLFAGVPLDEPLPPVSPDAQREVALVLYESLLNALPRRGLATLPAVVLSVAGGPYGRMLLAAPRASDDVLFALPGDTPAQASEAIAEFLRRWPRSAPAPHASPAIAELDATARVVPERGIRAPPLPSASGLDRFGAAIVAQVAGSLAHLFAARVGGADLLHRVRIPGRIEMAAERMLVELPMDGIDLDVRRAGFDASPGWMPWLRRNVQISFVDADDAHPG